MLTENALQVLNKRYLLKDDNGTVIETPKQMFRRVANAIGAIDAQYGANAEEVKSTQDQFYDMMLSRKFIPNSPTLMNAGKKNAMLSACFVIPVGDSMEEIFDAIKWGAIVHKNGGGTGFSFSRLRPKNSTVQSTHGVSSGPVSFMKVFNAATEAIKQGGTRRGANMGIMRVDHPDILEFIDCKQDLTQVTNFNISVALTNEFMKAARTGADYNLYNPKFMPQQKVVVGTLNSAMVFDRIIHNAWKTGEPGIIFIDRMNETSPTREHEIIECTNPCGEQPLPPFDSCTLGSINVSEFYSDEYKGIMWDYLRTHIRHCVHFLDNVLDANNYPLEQIKEQTLSNRRIGLGVMGFADLLIKMKIPYDSDMAIDLANTLIYEFYVTAYGTSQQLAKTRGSFPNQTNGKNTYYARPMRNATVLTVAPTGTISIIAGCSSGIEPIYAVVYTRNVMDGTRMKEINPIFEQELKRRNLYSESLIAEIKSKNSIQDIARIPDDLKKIFRTAADVSPEYHVKMQAAFQKYVDSSVSKTINLPVGSTQEDVKQSYWMAYELGCKAVSVYVDGSRPGQVLSTGETPTEARDTNEIRLFESSKPVMVKALPPGSEINSVDISTKKSTNIVTPTRVSTTEPRPEKLFGFTDKIKTGYGNLYVTVNTHDGKPFEVFATIGKSGFSIQADTEAITRMISLALRSGIDITTVVRQLQGIGGSQQLLGINGLVSSIPDAISKVLKKNFLDKNEHIAFGDINYDNERCPDCEALIQHKEGCVLCEECGYSKC